MPHFRAYFLDTGDNIVGAEDIEALDLSAAISAAQQLSTRHDKGVPCHIEVWSGRERLFPAIDDNPEREERVWDMPKRE